MITLHHLDHSRSQRVLWLLEELGIPCELKLYQRDPETLQAPASLRAVHPLGKSPVITENGQTIAESGAIVQYLLDNHDAEGKSGLMPAPGTAERLRFNYWLHYAEGSLMAPLLVSLIFARIQRSPMPFFVKPIVNAIVGKVKSGWLDGELKRHFDYMEAELGQSEWFAGAAFTAADIQMSYPLEAAESRIDLAAYPRLRAWLARIRARPAYQRAVERGGPAGAPG